MIGGGKGGNQESGTHKAREAFSQRQEIKEAEDATGAIDVTIVPTT